MRKKQGLRKKVAPLLMLLLVLAITVALLLYQDKVAELGNYGYLGVFLISLAFNATILLPMPIFAILFVLGDTFNPVLVGVAGAAGGAIGEMTGYMVGYSGRGVVQSNKMYARAEGWMRRWGALAIFIFTLVPFTPFDLVGMAAGALRFPIWKFLLICWFAKVLLYTALALAGAWGWDAGLPYLG